jgi:bifunctional UDP-N-acetylglucosamine pyrophosphorylase / glucosamine-1-phosphate N-acetyltransferase
LSSIRAVVLAAGKGTRMKSSLPKVYHEICGRSLLWWVLKAVRETGVEDVVVVHSPEMREGFDAYGVGGVLQKEQLGTGDALRVALDALVPRAGARVLVVSGDMPLVSPEIFRSAIEALNDAAMALVTVRAKRDSNFGRVVREGNRVRRIVEVRDASPEELAIEEANAGVYAMDEAKVRDRVKRLRNENAQREYYLTDLVEMIASGGDEVAAARCADERSLIGINDRVELARARAAMNRRLCEQHMRDGVTIVDPKTTYLEPELIIGRDTVIYPNSWIARLSQVGERCTVGPNARLSNARVGELCKVRESVVIDSTIGDGTQVGPYAHLRGETVLGQGVRVGNFVEIKSSRLESGAKASHLSYIGDAMVGEEANIGAGTITCNFDGKTKNRTRIGKRTMIGSNSSLVAPVDIGDDALTGAGSVVTKDVPDGGRVAGNPAKPLPPKASS